jgi:hypothetical protein
VLYKIGSVRCCVSKLFVHNSSSSPGCEIKKASGSGQGVGCASAANFGSSGVNCASNGLTESAASDKNVAAQGSGQIIPFGIAGETGTGFGHVNFDSAASVEKISGCVG